MGFDLSEVQHRAMLRFVDGGGAQRLFRLKSQASEAFHFIKLLKLNDVSSYMMYVKYAMLIAMHVRKPTIP